MPDDELGLSENENDCDISHKQKFHVLDISSDSETILYTNSSVGINTSDWFCKEDSIRKIETLNTSNYTMRPQENTRGSSVRISTCILKYTQNRPISLLLFHF